MRDSVWQRLVLYMVWYKVSRECKPRSLFVWCILLPQLVEKFTHFVHSAILLGTFVALSRPLSSMLGVPFGGLKAVLCPLALL